MRFQQIGGIVLLVAFLAFLGYQMTESLAGLADGPVLIALFTIILLMLALLVRRIAFEDR